MMLCTLKQKASRISEFFLKNWSLLFILPLFCSSTGNSAKKRLLGLFPQRDYYLGPYDVFRCVSVWECIQEKQLSANSGPAGRRYFAQAGPHDGPPRRAATLSGDDGGNPNGVAKIDYALIPKKDVRQKTTIHRFTDKKRPRRATEKR